MLERLQTVPKVIVCPHEKKLQKIFEIPQEQVGEIAENTPEVIVEVPKEKGGEAEKTPELRVKRKRKFRVNEGSTIAQSSSRKTRSTPEEQVPAPTSKPPGRKTRSAQT
jgi:hypothetical protein